VAVMVEIRYLALKDGENGGLGGKGGTESGDGRGEFGMGKE